MISDYHYIRIVDIIYNKMMDLLKPPSTTNHIGIEYISWGFYPPIISITISMLSTIIYLGIQKNYYYMWLSLCIFPILWGSIIIWLHLILDVINTIIHNNYRNGLLKLGENPVYNPLSIPIQNQSTTIDEYQSIPEAPIPPTNNINCLL